MQGKKNLFIARLLVAVFTFFLVLVSLASPAGATSNSGQGEQSQRVTSNGTITFEATTTTTTSTSSSTSSSSSTTTSSSGVLPDTGGGKLPQTNELVTQGLVIAGIGLLIIGLFFLLWKRRRKGDDHL